MLYQKLLAFVAAAWETPMFGHTERLTRRELYDLVWSTPMMTLAERYRLSGNGLAKVCARHDIPVPERGYWQRLEAGKPTKQPQLRPARHELLETVEIHVKSDPTEWLTEEQTADFDQRIGREDSADHRIVVESGTSHLPLITSTRRWMNRPTSDEFHLDVRVSKDSRDRALRIAAAFVKACQKRGYPLRASTARENSTVSTVVQVVVCDEAISFHVFEPTNRIEHVLTPKEQRERAAGRGWLIPKYDFVPTAKLQLVIDSYAGSEQRTFSDTATAPLEDRLNEVMVGLLRTAMVLKARENYWAAEREAREQEQRRRSDEEGRIQVERRRRRALLRDAANFSRAESLNRLIVAVQAAVGAADHQNEQVRNWLIEARQLAHSLNPLNRIIRS